MILPDLNQSSCELEKLVLFFIAFPIEPADLVVLAISVVISVLRPAPLIAAGQHRHALRKEKRSQEISALTIAQGIDLRVIRRPFHATVPREIVTVAVLVAVAVRLIVFFIVADQVVESEPVVRGNEIDAGIWASPVVPIKIGAPSEPVAHLANAALVAFPKTANRVAVFALPFRKRHRKITNLIAAVPDVPRFRN